MCSTKISKDLMDMEWNADKTDTADPARGDEFFIRVNLLWRRWRHVISSPFPLRIYH